MIVYEGVFDRGANTARCGDVTVSPRGERDHVFPLCRALVEAGLPDGELRLFDERGVMCLVVNSIYLGAKFALHEGDRFSITKYVPFTQNAQDIVGHYLAKGS
jgi:hypothetical protein